MSTKRKPWIWGQVRGHGGIPQIQGVRSAKHVGVPYQLPLVPRRKRVTGEGEREGFLPGVALVHPVQSQKKNPPTVHTPGRPKKENAHTCERALAAGARAGAGRAEAAALGHLLDLVGAFQQLLASSPMDGTVQAQSAGSENGKTMGGVRKQAKPPRDEQRKKKKKKNNRSGVRMETQVAFSSPAN